MTGYPFIYNSTTVPQNVIATDLFTELQTLTGHFIIFNLVSLLKGFSRRNENLRFL